MRYFVVQDSRNIHLAKTETPRNRIFKVYMQRFFNCLIYIYIYIYICMYLSVTVYQRTIDIAIIGRDYYRKGTYPVKILLFCFTFSMVSVIFQSKFADILMLVSNQIFISMGLF